jgi:hypothetical protein
LHLAHAASPGAATIVQSRFASFDTGCDALDIDL